jgi:hypothetical protein
MDEAAMPQARRLPVKLTVPEPAFGDGGGDLAESGTGGAHVDHVTNHLLLGGNLHMRTLLRLLLAPACCDNLSNSSRN